MKTQAIILAAMTLLMAAEAGLIKPPPGTAGGLIKPQPGIDAELTKPIPETGDELLKPAPGAGAGLSKPAPGTGEALIKPAPGTGGVLTRPATGTDGSLTRPAPGTGDALIKPAPGTGGELIKPAPGGESELIKPAPGGESELIKPAPGGESELIKPLPGTDEELIKPLPGTGGELIKPLPGTGGELIKPLPGTGGELIKPLPGTGGELIKPLPGTGGELIKPLPGTGGELIKPLPGTGGELIKPLPGTGEELIKPGPGSDLIQPQPLPGTDNELTKPAPETRKVLPNLVLSAVLENAVQNAEISVSSRIQKDAKLYHTIPTAADLKLGNIYLQIDDDISVQLSNLQLVNVPVIDVTSANPDLEFLNLGLDIDLGTLEVGGSFHITSKNVLSELPVTSSGDLFLRNSDVKGTGKVGLSLAGDFFKTINYDVLYKPIGSYLSVSYESDNQRIVSGLDVGQHEAKVVNHINRELKNVLNRLVKKRLDDVLEAIPVNELIRETRTAESYREHARAIRIVGNEYVDNLLQSLHDYVEVNQLNEIDTPNLSASFSKEILWITWHGHFTATQGRVRNLASLTRISDISLEYNENAGGITVFGSLGLTELRVHYNQYETEFQGIGPSGTLDASVGQNSVFLKVDIVLSANPTISLHDLFIEHANDISVEVTGLGILDWLVSNISSWVIGLFNDEVVDAVSSQLQEYVTEILPNVDPNRVFA